MMYNKKIFLVVLISLLSFVGIASATNINFTDDDSNDHLRASAENWASDTIPGPSDKAQIHDLDDGITCDINSTQSVEHLRVAYFNSSTVFTISVITFCASKKLS